LKTPVAHLGGLAQEGQAEADGFAPFVFAAPAVREHALERGRVHPATVVPHAQHEPVMPPALQNADLHFGGVGGERIHGDVENVL
jgi:hypothetical protein